MFSEKFDLKKTFVKFNPLCVGNPGPPKLYGTRKVMQLTGDNDRQIGKKTSNQTIKRLGIYGTDLGVSFLYDGKLYFLFGDTTRRGPTEGIPDSAMPGSPLNEDSTDYDAIAFTTSDRAYDGISLMFNSEPPLVDNISQLTAEHPIEGFSMGKEMYVFFTTDLNPNRRILPRRSVLAKSVDGGYNFGNSLYSLSTHKFIHVSVQIVDNDKIEGLPKTSGKGLLLWGTGKYRQSDVYLAYISLEDITNRSSIYFFAGFETNSYKPLWKSDESTSIPLFSAGCIGEISVRWNFYLNKWIMLYNCELCNASGVIVRLADKAWGPWSGPRIVFDHSDAYSKFIHQPGQDNLADDEGRENPFDWGYEYGPYQMTPYATGIKGRYTKIYFTLSTWNPYQVLQMSAIILSQEEEMNPVPYATNLSDRNDRKYAHISVLLSHLANTKKIIFKDSIHNSTYIADHIEWAQFHSHIELRNAIKSKISQLIDSLAADIDLADVYTAITASILPLGYNYDKFNNIVNIDIYKKWALNVVHTGNREWLIAEINKYIDSEHFLPDNDHFCYAYGPEDSNEFKYARISLLEAKLANELGIQLEPPFQQANFNAHIAWARFRSVEEMRDNLCSKFKQIVYNFKNSKDINEVCKNIIKTIITLTCNGSADDNFKYNVDQSTIEEEHDAIIRKVSEFICDDNFLKTAPSSRIP